MLSLGDVFKVGLLLALVLLPLFLALILLLLGHNNCASLAPSPMHCACAQKCAWREWHDARRPQSDPLFETIKGFRREVRKRINLCH